MAHYTDSIMEPKKVTFRAFNGATMEMTENFTGDAVVSVGVHKVVIPVQDLLNAARFLGAKEIDVKLK